MHPPEAYIQGCQRPQENPATLFQRATRPPFALANLYLSKVPMAAVDVLDDRVLPFCEEHSVETKRALTDMGANTAVASGPLPRGAFASGMTTAAST